VPGCSPQQAALRAWLLGLARELLDPKINNAEEAARPEPKAEPLQKSGGVQLPLTGAIGPFRVSSSLTSGSVQHSQHGGCAEETHSGLIPALTRNSSAKARFAFLENKVSGDCPGSTVA
jgi:hypothetical protein